MDLRNALRMLRSETGLTQMEFASAVYVSFSTVNRWENRGMRPNRMQSKEILQFARKRQVSAACLELLTTCLLSPRVKDKTDRERMKLANEQTKLLQPNLLTAEQFMKTLDNIDTAIVGQRFFERKPATCDVFYQNSCFAELFGYAPDEFKERMRRDPFFAIADQARHTLTAQFEELLFSRVQPQDFLVVIQATHKDGSTFWLEIKAASVTEYSYGQEVFTYCRDVTRRVEAERRYTEEVLLRDTSMQIMFSNVYCDLTENLISRHYNLSSVLGRAYHEGTPDELIRAIADVAPENEERDSFIKRFSRDALLQAYERGEVYGSAVLYNRHLHRWFRNEYLLVKNSISGNIHGLLYVFDIQRQVQSESMLHIFLDQFFEFVGLIDVQAQTVEAYYYAENVFLEQHLGHVRHYPTICEEKLRHYGYEETAAQDSQAIDLRTVLRQLDKKAFYSVVLPLRGYDGACVYKKITYTYLDDNRNTLVVAQSDFKKVQSVQKRFNLPSPKRTNG